MSYRVLNTPLINYPLALALKSMFSFKLLSSDFSRKEILTLLKMLVKQYTAERKMISEYRKILSLIQSKELAEISTVSTSIRFQFS